MQIGKVLPIFFMFALAACGFDADMRRADNNCKPSPLGTYFHWRTASEITACYDRAERPIIIKYHPELVNSYDEFFAQRAAIARKLDDKEITDTEYKQQMDTAKIQLTNIIRNEIQAKHGAEKIEETAKQESFDEDMRERQAEWERQHKIEEKREKAEETRIRREQKVAEVKAEKEAREQIKREKAYAAKIKREQLAADKATCRDYGIPKGTKEFSACLIQVAQARQQQAQQQQLRQVRQAEQLQAQENEKANQAAIIAAYNDCVNRGNIAASLCAFARSNALTCQLNAMTNVINTCKAQYGQ